jgi:hypothetical protein
MQTLTEVEMNRREFTKGVVMLGVTAHSGSALGASEKPDRPPAGYYEEPARKLPIREYDVVVAGAGTAGVVAALAAARQGARTILIELLSSCSGNMCPAAKRHSSPGPARR